MKATSKGRLKRLPSSYFCYRKGSRSICWLVGEKRKGLKLLRWLWWWWWLECVPLTAFVIQSNFQLWLKNPFNHCTRGAEFGYGLSIYRVLLFTHSLTLYVAKRGKYIFFRSTLGCWKMVLGFRWHFSSAADFLLDAFKAFPTLFSIAFSSIMPHSSSTFLRLSLFCPLFFLFAVKQEDEEGLQNF